MTLLTLQCPYDGAYMCDSCNLGFLMAPDKKSCKEISAFKAALGARNGVAARNYEFKYTKLHSTSGIYATLMVESCRQYGMKPVWSVYRDFVALVCSLACLPRCRAILLTIAAIVCSSDHPSYCKNDKNSLYLGQVKF